MKGKKEEKRIRPLYSTQIIFLFMFVGELLISRNAGWLIFIMGMFIIVSAINGYIEIFR